MARRKRKSQAGGEPPKPTTTAGPLRTGLGPLLTAAAASRDKPAPKAPDPPAPNRSIPPTQPAPGPEPLVPVTVPPAPKVPQAPGKASPEQASRPRSATELRWLNDAYEGATPLGHTRQGRTAERSRPPTPTGTEPRSGVGERAQSGESAEDAQVRARLGALVGEGARFAVDQREDGWVQARQQGVGRAVLRNLGGPGFHPEATLDLHGQTRSQVASVVTRFVREQHQRGCRYLLLIHGKGLHSEGGQGVLGDAVFEALTNGGGAPLVHAMRTPHASHGGRGALAVVLR